MMFKMMFKIILMILYTISTCHTANILYISLLPSPSHHIWNSAIYNELAERDHNITIVSPFLDPDSPSNVHYLSLDGMQRHQIIFVKSVLDATESVNPFYEVLLLQYTYDRICADAVQTNAFRTLLNYPDNFKFDLVLYDLTVGSCFLPFVHKFNYPPLIAVTAFGHPSFTNDLIGGHHYYAYVPHMTLPFDSEMTFFQRFYNFIIYAEEILLFKYYLTPRLDAITKKYFGPNVPSISELEQRTSLAFVNTNPTFDYIAPLPENVIPIAGVQIKDPKPLPDNLKSFIESAKKGVVVFSLGTNFRSEFLPKEKQKIFLDVFSELPEYHFLWKHESNISAADLPKNVQIHPWLPLSDILADSNVKAIFFHGGALTTQETLWRGMPMVIMPLALDQIQNLIKTKRLGVSEGVEYFSLNQKDVKIALLKVLEDPSYMLNAKKWSAAFQDQKEKPIDRAIWYIEWLLRNPNCDYLKSPVFRLGFIAGNAYDIIAFITLFICLSLLILYKIFYYCIKKNLICAPRNVNSERKKFE